MFYNLVIKIIYWSQRLCLRDGLPGDIGQHYYMYMYNATGSAVWQHSSRFPEPVPHVLNITSSSSRDSRIDDPGSGRVSTHDHVSGLSGFVWSISSHFTIHNRYITDIMIPGSDFQTVIMTRWVANVDDTIQSSNFFPELSRTYRRKIQTGAGSIDYSFQVL